MRSAPPEGAECGSSERPAASRYASLQASLALLRVKGPRAVTAPVDNDEVRGAAASATGTVHAVRGSVVDVRFDSGVLPALDEALVIAGANRPLLAEVRLYVDPHTVRAVALEPTSGLARGAAVHAVDILFPCYTGAAGAELVERRLLPLDPGILPSVRGDPLLNLPADELADAVLSEWVLGEFVHAVAETLTSENGARSSVEYKLVGLRGAYRVARQEVITSEIAEVVGGLLTQKQP